MNQTARDILTGARQEISAKLGDAEARAADLGLEHRRAEAEVHRWKTVLSDLDEQLAKG